MFLKIVLESMNCVVLIVLLKESVGLGLHDQQALGVGADHIRVHTLFSLLWSLLTLFDIH